MSWVSAVLSGLLVLLLTMACNSAPSPADITALKATLGDDAVLQPTDVLYPQVGCHLHTSTGDHHRRRS